MQRYRGVLRQCTAAAFVCAALLVMSCNRRDNLSAADAAAAERLVGTWKARFESQGALLSGQSGRLVEVSGLVAFVHRGADESFRDLDRPTNMGSFDVDFSPLGFDVRDARGAPMAAARTWAGDSIIVLLGGVEPEPAVRMTGRWAGDSVVGTWWVVSSRTASAKGTFVLTQRRGG